jgi:hypothetical protein
VDDTAKLGVDYTKVDEVVTMDKKDIKYIIKIPIIDDDAWQPDMDFFVDLYDPET